MLNRNRFRLRLVVFFIYVLLSVSVAFQRQYWSLAGSRTENLLCQSRSSTISRLCSTTSKDASVDVPRNTTPPLINKQPAADLSSLRGGENDLTAKKAAIQQYLGSLGESRTSLENFQIHGWRWHTRSLIREVGRLHKLALKTNPSSVQKLQDATEYVIDFNLRGLHNIETDLFFPWIRQQLTSRPKEQSVSKAFASVMDELEQDRVQVAQLGRTISQNARMAGDTSNSRDTRSGAIEAVADQSAKLQTIAQHMMQVEDDYLVPAVAALVPEKEQKTFNNKVLRGLGLLDSRLHLVSMYEAVEQDPNSKAEKELFKKNIPSVPQMMIPRWKRKLYAPRTSMLE
ncbi:MAG: hypothetical protein SGILL_008923 [Bacillariaceae sp.]